jgi:hypothetical protein
VSASFHARTVSQGQAAVPAALAVSASFPAPAVSAGSAVTVTPPALAVSASFPAPVIAAGATVTPGSLAVSCQLQRSLDPCRPEGRPAPWPSRRASARDG